MHIVTKMLRKPLIPHWIGERISENPPSVLNMASRIVTVIPVPLGRDLILYLLLLNVSDDLQSIMM
jgi:hypothetical protein